MNKYILIGLGGLALMAGLYVASRNPYTESADFASQAIVAEGSYLEIATDISSRIHTLSPHPPVAGKWTVQKIEFAKGTNLAYIIYHDTGNIFRVLAEIGKNQDGKYQYRLRATFKPREGSWVLENGQDLAKGVELVTINVNE